MSERTTRKTVIFSRPFSLGYDAEVFPAGQYAVDTVDELLESLSFTAYRRVATIINVRSGVGIERAVTIDQGDLDKALLRDHKPEETGRTTSGRPTDHAT